MSHEVDIDTIIRQAEDAIFGDNRHGRDGAQAAALVNLGILYQLGRIADALERANYEIDKKIENDERVRREIGPIEPDELGRF